MSSLARFQSQRLGRVGHFWALFTHSNPAIRLPSARLPSTRHAPPATVLVRVRVWPHLAASRKQRCPAPDSCSQFIAKIFIFFEPRLLEYVRQANSSGTRRLSKNEPARTACTSFDGYCSALAKPNLATVPFGRATQPRCAPIENRARQRPFADAARADCIASVRRGASGRIAGVRIECVGAHREIQMPSPPLRRNRGSLFSSNDLATRRFGKRARSRCRGIAGRGRPHF
jgi:hypothetical protein